VNDVENDFENENNKLESTVSILQAGVDANKLEVQYNAKLSGETNSLVFNLTKILNDHQENLEIAKNRLESIVSALKIEVDDNKATTTKDRESLVSSFTKIVNDLQDDFGIENTRLESKISSLEAKLDAKNAKLIDDTQSFVSNFTKIVNDVKNNFGNENNKLESIVSILQDEVDANKLEVQNNAKLCGETNSLVFNFKKIVNDFRIEETRLKATLSTLQAEVDANHINYIWILASVAAGLALFALIGLAFFGWRHFKLHSIAEKAFTNL